MSDFMLFSFFQSGKIVIPLYQRNYDWKKQNCKQLLDDVRRLIDDPSKRHFTGALIYTNDGLSRVIIDGQQRITTVQLLLLALRDAINGGTVSSKDGDTLPFIRSLIGKGDNVLQPCGKDLDAFLALYNGKFDDAWSVKEYGNTNLWKNYFYLKDEISNSNIGDDYGDRLYGAIIRLWVSPIELKEKDDPQAVFESINTTGLKLSDSDRIRNFIMMNHSQSEQQKIYDQYWTRIEEYAGNEIESFFIDFLKAETFSKVSSSNNGVFLKFKEHFPEVKERGDKKWEILDHIRKCAQIYGQMLKGNIADHSSEEASRGLRYITYLGQKVSYSFILNILVAQAHGDITKDDAARSILVIENYLERRQTTKAPTNALNTLFPTLFRTVRALPGDAPFSDKLTYNLTTRQGTLEFPGDDVVREKLRELDIYKASATCGVVLSIADYMNRDSPDVLNKIGVEEGYTIDHILPQNPDGSWYREIPDLEEVSGKYLNKIGNLTLTTYNSNFGNRSFQYRMNADVIGYIHSPLHINDYLKKQEHWGEKQIVERAEIIIDDFLKNRPIPSANGYSPSDDNVFEYIAGEDSGILAGKDIIGVSFDNGPVIPVRNGVECFKAILRNLYEEYPDTFTEWANDDSPRGVSSCFHTTEEGYAEVASGIYVWTNMSNEDKFRFIRMVIDELGYDGSRIVVKYQRKKARVGNGAVSNQ